MVSVTFFFLHRTVRRMDVSVDQTAIILLFQSFAMLAALHSYFTALLVLKVWSIMAYISGPPILLSAFISSVHKRIGNALVLALHSTHHVC